MPRAGACVVKQTTHTHVHDYTHHHQRRTHDQSDEADALGAGKQSWGKDVMFLDCEADPLSSFKQTGAGWSKWLRVIQDQKHREGLTELQLALDDKRAAEKYAERLKADFVIERRELEEARVMLESTVQQLTGTVAQLEKEIFTIKLSAIDVSEAAEAREEEIQGERDAMQAERQNLLDEIDKLRGAASESSLSHARENADLSARCVIGPT